MIVIVDYGMGNLGSIKNMLKKIGVDGKITSDPADIQQASKIILPGVGAFDTGMRNLNELGLIPLLNQKVLVEQVPTLGICLGMQLMSQCSEEGQLPGLGWVEAETLRFKSDEATPLKIPHMGWNTVRIAKDSVFFDAQPGEQRFYFVHSYHVKCRRAEDVLLQSTYGHDFDSGCARANIAGVQFHPEKSHKFGLQLLRNFVERF